MSSVPSTSPAAAKSPSGRAPVGGDAPSTGTVTGHVDAVIEVDHDWTIRYANRTAGGFLHEAPDTLAGRSLWDVLPAAATVQAAGAEAPLAEQIRRAASGGGPVRLEIQLPERGQWLKIQMDPLDDGLVVILRDVTESRAAKLALERAEARHRAILNAVPDLILWVSPEGLVVDAEPAALPTGHPTASELMGRHLSEALPPKAAGRILQALAAGDDVMPVAIEYSLAHGSFEARVVPAGERGAIVVVRDITERHALERAVLNAGDEERRRIGRDLHDGLASHLTGVAMLASRLARDCRRDRAVEAENLDELAALIREGVRQARLLAHGLNPVMLEQEGICSALHALAESSQIVGDVECSFVGGSTLDRRTAPDGCQEFFPPVEAPVATHLLRIAQEAVHNARRHAEASRITISLGYGWDHLFLGIQDDGRGLPPGTPEGMGMHVMRYRAQLIGARLHIDSRPGGGTTVTCDLPLPAAGRSA
jgi:two-component system, LuxR family, sensor kinase FixL